MTRPTLRLPYHRGTTANTATLYPFSVQPTFGPRGAFIGVDLLGGSAEFCWDPFEAYRSGVVTNPNTWVFGEPGNGKSALVKSFIFRQAAIYGTDGHRRWVSILDPKGEYRPLAEALGFTIIELSPAGRTRINPLDPHLADDPHPERRTLRQAELCAALIQTVLNRPLNQREDSLLYAAVQRLAAAPVGRAPTLNQLASLLQTAGSSLPPTGVDGETLVLALDKLLSRSLRGMFDGESTIRPDWNGPGILVDLSALGIASDALAVVMTAATAWLNEIAARPGPQRLQVLDEAWALLGNAHTAAYLQRAFKLGRSTGTANLCIAHRVTDLAAQADDGTSTAKIADGLLADSATKVILRQAADQIDQTTVRFGLTRTEGEVVSRLVRGRALWKVGARTAVVQHQLSAIEAALCDTDARMAGHQQA
jgi:type IV secretory pathway VirB4 component